MLVAHSFGGAVAMAAACTDQPFTGLVMIDTPVNLDRERLREIRAGAPKPRDQPPAFASLAEGLARFRLSPPQDCVNDFIGDYIARRSLVERDGKWYWHFDPRRITAEGDGQEDIVSRVRCPMAYFYGEYSALITPEAIARSQEAFPAGTPIVCIPEAAHHVLIDQPLALISSLNVEEQRATWPAPKHLFRDVTRRASALLHRRLRSLEIEWSAVPPTIREEVPGWLTEEVVRLLARLRRRDPLRLAYDALGGGRELEFCAIDVRDAAAMTVVCNVILNLDEMFLKR